MERGFNMNLHERLLVCATCVHRQRPCAGACTCTVDGKRLEDRGICPKGYFEPGAVVEVIPATYSAPLADWPWWAKAIKKRAQPREKGIGDTLARKFGGAGERFKRAMERIGIECGCQQRQEWLNARYPYGVKDEAP